MRTLSKYQIWTFYFSSYSYGGYAHWRTQIPFVDLGYIQISISSVIMKKQYFCTIATLPVTKDWENVTGDRHILKSLESKKLVFWKWSVGMCENQVKKTQEVRNVFHLRTPIRTAFSCPEVPLCPFFPLFFWDFIGKRLHDKWYKLFLSICTKLNIYNLFSEFGDSHLTTCIRLVNEINY